jgi:purine-nucleoside/S-methyl-5'-thioadenosine phosphorylase / adenosine deaminase
MGFQRRQLGDRAHALVSSDLEDIGVLGAFTERGGGDSSAPFDSLNASFSVGDDPAAVRANRRRIVEGLGVPPFAIAALVHGDYLVRVGSKRAGAGFEDPAESIAGADGLLATGVGVSLAVTSADCVPLVFASPSEPTIAVVHAGWQGFAAGIIARTAAAFERTSDLHVAIGPAIGPCHYEVGEDVALAVASGSDAGAVASRREGRTVLDLVATARGILKAAGVRRIEDTGLCTACEGRRFYSHRRDGASGRQAAVAMRLDG